MSTAEDRPFESMQAGETASFERTITQLDVDAFAHLSGDQNPLHVDRSYAVAASYGGRVVHGMFLGALMSQLVGMRLPGKRALLMSESLEFKKPVHVGDTVLVEGIIVRTSASTRIIELGVSITVKGIIVAAGQARVMVRTA